MFKRHDWTIFVLMIILSIIGGFTLLSTNIAPSGEIQWDGVFSKQILFFLIGLLCYFSASFLNPTYLRFPQIALPIYLVTVGMLVSVLYFGPEINNVKRWLLVGGIQIQPSEVAKLFVIIITASIFAVRNRFDDLILALISGALLIPILFLIYLEPHGSMTLITMMIWAFMILTYMREQRRNILLGIILIGGASSIALFLNSLQAQGVLIGIVTLAISTLAFYKLEQIQKLVLAFAISGLLLGGLLSVGWNNILRDYQRDRIETFFSPETVDADQSFNVEQSKVAIGSGGIWGKGFASGTQSRLRYLPEHQTDFIFATFAEQFGLFGSVIVIGLFALLIAKLFLYALRYLSTDLFLSMIVFGIGIKLLIEVFINIGTNSGLIPATGIPLPFFSAGGTNIIVTYFSFGLIQSIISSVQENSPSVEMLIDNEDLLI